MLTQHEAGGFNPFKICPMDKHYTIHQDINYNEAKVYMANSLLQMVCCNIFLFYYFMKEMSWVRKLIWSNANKSRPTSLKTWTQSYASEAKLSLGCQS